jgi:hypothetical protein
MTHVIKSSSFFESDVQTDIALYFPRFWGGVLVLMAKKYKERVP